MIRQAKAEPLSIRRAAFLRKILINRFIWIRLIALAICVMIYLFCDWTFLIKLLRNNVAFVLNELGHSTVCFSAGSNMSLAVGSSLFVFYPYCTYVDLFLVLLPFSWRYRKRLDTNILRFVTLACCIWAVNLVRVSLAMSLCIHGVSWELAHTIPYGLIYFIAIIVFSWMAIKKDLELREHNTSFNINISLNNLRKVLTIRGFN